MKKRLKESRRCRKYKGLEWDYLEPVSELPENEWNIRFLEDEPYVAKLYHGDNFHKKINFYPLVRKHAIYGDSEDYNEENTWCFIYYECRKIAPASRIYIHFSDLSRDILKLEKDTEIELAYYENEKQHRGKQKSFDF